tara:strand:- start:2974 stop:4023 length:1050 start_codon:yes stop_codon:yes gene_type:complete
MTWRRNPRTITKEQFSTGTTIDGDRIDNALDDVVERVNNISHGDIKKRWVPITYVAGWTPQSPATIERATPDPTASGKSYDGEVAAMHHWPWLRVRNWYNEVAAGTLGAAIDDDVTFTNPYRLKGVGAPGIHPYGQATGAVGGEYTIAGNPVGEQYAWTRSWFLERPSILDSIDLVLEVDHSGSALGADRPFQNSFEYGAEAPDGYQPLSDDHGLAITAAVDNEFDRESRNMADVEVLRKRFAINNDAFSILPLPTHGGGSPAYSTFEPTVDNAVPCQATTIQGVHVRLNDLNIPIHQNARLRISVVIPSYPTALQPNGWNPNNYSKLFPWLQQKMHMTVTMLEEVTSG